MTASGIRRSALGLLLLLASVPSASASALKLSWDHCSGDGRVPNKVLACDPNDGTDVLVGTFVLDQALTDVFSITTEVAFVPTARPMPSWWGFEFPPTCRTPGLFAVLDASVGSGLCRNPWRAAAGGLADISLVRVEPGVLLTMDFGVAYPNRCSLQPGDETPAFQLLISHENAAGPDACEGCGAPMCILFRKAVIWHGSENAPVVMALPQASTDGSQATVTANAAGHSTTSIGCDQLHGCWFNVTCTTATPAENRTWGTIKSMYR